MSQAIALQFRHGTTSEHASFTGILAEVTVDTDLKMEVGRSFGILNLS